MGRSRSRSSEELRRRPHQDRSHRRPPPLAAVAEAAARRPPSNREATCSHRNTDKAQRESGSEQLRLRLRRRQRQRQRCRRARACAGSEGLVCLVPRWGERRGARGSTLSYWSHAVSRRRAAILVAVAGGLAPPAATSEVSCQWGLRGADGRRWRGGGLHAIF